MLLFESFNEIESICQKYGIRNYTINPDGTVDVHGNVDLYSKRLKKIPIRFGRVTGNFNCSCNKLMTLEGGPKEVGGNFSCRSNGLKSLEGCPEYVGNNFICNDNELVTLEGSPKWVGGDFWCRDNQLTTLQGLPEWVGGTLWCTNNKLISLEGSSKELRGKFYCDDNPIYNIFKLFGEDYKSFQDSLDYGYLRGTNIVRSRFKEALEEIGVELPESIEDYKYI